MMMEDDKEELIIKHFISLLDSLGHTDGLNPLKTASGKHPMGSVGDNKLDPTLGEDPRQSLRPSREDSNTVLFIKLWEERYSVNGEEEDISVDVESVCRIARLLKKDYSLPAFAPSFGLVDVKTKSRCPKDLEIKILTAIHFSLTLGSTFRSWRFAFDFTKTGKEQTYCIEPDIGRPGHFTQTNNETESERVVVLKSVRSYSRKNMHTKWTRPLAKLSNEELVNGLRDLGMRSLPLLREPTMKVATSSPSTEGAQRSGPTGTDIRFSAQVWPLSWDKKDVSDAQYANEPVVSAVLPFDSPLYRSLAELLHRDLGDRKKVNVTEIRLVVDPFQRYDQFLWHVTMMEKYREFTKSRVGRCLHWFATQDMQRTMDICTERANWQDIMVGPRTAKEAVKKASSSKSFRGTILLCEMATIADNSLPRLVRTIEARSNEKTVVSRNMVVVVASMVVEIA